MIDQIFQALSLIVVTIILGVAEFVAFFINAVASFL